MYSVILILVLISISICPISSKKTNSDYYIDEEKYFDNYRVINWCVTGRHEDAIFKWPLIQFKPYLMRTEKFRNFDDKENKANGTNKDKVKDNKKEESTTKSPAGNGTSDVQPTYSLDFNQLTCEGNTAYFGKSEFHQRAHVVFKSSQPIEGLLLQAVHAPFGMGFPFGQFDHSGKFSETPCKCEKDFMTIVPCLTRPDVSMVHPTVAVYHFRQIKSTNGTDKGNSEGGEGGGGGGDEGGRKKRQAESSTKKPEGPNPDEPKPKEEGEPKEGEGEGFKKPHDEHMKQGEIHVNFKWFNNPCSSARIVEFWALIVHSFFNNKFEIYKFGPYNMENDKSSAQDNKDSKDKPLIPYYMPTPIMPPCRAINSTAGNSSSGGGGDDSTPPDSHIKCEGTGKYVFSTKDKYKFEYTSSISRIRFEGLYDTACINQYKDEQQPGKQCSNWTSRFYCSQGNERVLNDPVEYEEKIPKRLFNNSFCQPCSTLPPEGDDQPFVLIKIDCHGCLMVLVFFVLMPMFMVIARYYKEVLHYERTKGWRIWLWIHFGLAHFSMLFGYIAYIIVTYEKRDSYIHMDLGFAALILFGLSMISGWGRHRHWCMFQVMMTIHVIVGYATWAIGVGAFFTTRSITTLSRIAGYTAFVISLCVEVILTIWICCLDKKLGLEPSRRHIPIVQVRFDSVYLPQHKARLIFLYCYIAVLLLMYGCILCL